MHCLAGLCCSASPGCRPGLEKEVGAGPLAGLALAAFHALTWPHCLQRLEGVSPEVERLWLSHVREARPIYLHGWRVALVTWRSRSRGDRLAPAGVGSQKRSRLAAAHSFRRCAGDCRQLIAAVANPHRTRRAIDGGGWRRRAVLAFRADPVARENAGGEGNRGCRGGRHRAGRCDPACPDLYSRQAANPARRSPSARPTGCARRCGVCTPIAISRRHDL